MQHAADCLLPRARSNEAQVRAAHGRIVGLAVSFRYVHVCVCSVSLRVSGSGSEEGFSRNAVFS